MTSTGPKVCIHAALAWILLQISPGFAQSIPVKVDGNVIKTYVEQMSGDTQLGRKSLTPGYEKIADWVASRFKEWGVSPAGENGTYFQSVPLRGDRTAFSWALGIPELVIQGRTFYVRDNDFRIDPASTAATRVAAEIVFVGYGISAPGKGLDEYTTDVRGKVVLALKGSPRNAPAARGFFAPGQTEGEAAKDTEEWKEESADMFKAKIAYDKGAAAILLYDPAPPPVTPGGRPARRDVESSPFSRPFLYINNIDARVFRWILSRDPQETERGFGMRVDQIRRDIKARKPRSSATGARGQIKGYDSVALYGEKFKNNVSRNVLGKIEGSDPVLKEEYIIVGAHLDHVGVTDGVVYNGADDNASGSAVTMEVARLMAAQKIRPRRTVIFGLWCGEEMGLLGSRFFVSAPVGGVSMSRVAGYFNMDMVGLGTRIGAPGALNFPEIWEVIKRDQDPEVLKLVDARTGGPGGSDHTPFIELGIEALALMTSGGVGHPDYHDAADDPAKIDAGILGKTGQFVLQGVVNLANESRMNLIVPDREHVYNAMRMNVPDVMGNRSGSWEYIKANNPEDLIRLVSERAKEMKKAQQAPRPATPPMMRMGGQSRARFNLGVPDAWVFGGNVPLLEVTATVLDLGRVDVPKDDRYWFNDGVTASGREAVKTMEANDIILNLVNPYSRLLQDVVQIATKPFMITIPAKNSLDVWQLAQLKEKNVVLVIECAQGEIQGCVDRLETAKKGVGGSKNLALSMHLSDKVEESKRDLYLSLVKKGWTKDELNGIVGVGTGDNSRGNLTKLLPK